MESCTDGGGGAGSGSGDRGRGQNGGRCGGASVGRLWGVPFAKGIDVYLKELEEEEHIKNIEHVPPPQTISNDWCCWYN